MKKLICFAIVAILCSTVASAQSAIVSSRSKSISVVETKQPSTTQWVLRAGANFAGVTGDDTEDLDRKFAYDLSLSFQKPLSDFGMYWGMEFALGSRGFSAEEKDYDYKLTALAHNFRYSPFTFGYAYAFNESVKIDAHLGAWLSYDYYGLWTVEYDGESESESIYDMDDYMGFDAGIALGVGVWFDRFNVDLTWQRGFVGMFEDTEAYSNNLRLSLGIAF